MLAPSDAYHPGYLFDGRLDFGWVEGVKGPGIGEPTVLTLGGEGLAWGEPRWPAPADASW